MRSASPTSVRLEIVSVSWKKDHVDGPQRYAQLGCSERAARLEAELARVKAERK
jgi:hypothetical protein